MDKVTVFFYLDKGTDFDVYKGTDFNRDKGAVRCTPIRSAQDSNLGCGPVHTMSSIVKSSPIK